MERFAGVCEAAGEQGLQACLEFMIFSSVKTIADAERVLNRAGHPAGAILVHALHLQRSGGTPADVSAIAPERLPMCNCVIWPVPADPPGQCGGSYQARDGRLFPGEGRIAVG